MGFNNKKIFILCFSIGLLITIGLLIYKNGTIVDKGIISRSQESKIGNENIKDTWFWKAVIQNYGKLMIKSDTIEIKTVNYTDNERENIIGKEHILYENGVLLGSIYVVSMKAVTTEASESYFFTPGFSLTEKLDSLIGTSVNNKYFHYGNCVMHEHIKKCLNNKKDDSSLNGIRVSSNDGLQFQDLEGRVRNYFGQTELYSIGDRGFIYYNPVNKRVFDPTPGSTTSFDSIRH